MPGILDSLGGKQLLRMAVVDSGLGGLLITAGLEERLRRSALPGGPEIHLLYVNVWPDEKHGYNDLPDEAARAAVFDKALRAVAAMEPDRILIACNTLSVLYHATEFSRSASVPVAGVIEEGVRLFHEHLTADPDGKLIIFGTRTTIGSGEHVRLLTGLGIDRGRISACACHGLAAAIDKNPQDPGLAGRVEECVQQALEGAGFGGAGTIYAGLGCTHYGYIQDLFRNSLHRLSGAEVIVLDPSEGVVRSLTAGLAYADQASGGRPNIIVAVISKVELDRTRREAVAGRLEELSPETALALLSYAWMPMLF